MDPSFRVYGTTNVHVCDASVFPSSITVNPQLTVMALAAYAADEIAGTAARAALRSRESRSQRAAPGPGLVGAERPRAHAGAQVVAEASVVLGDAVDQPCAAPA